MHAFTYLVLSFAGAAHGLPAFLAESKRSLINISPVIDLGLKLTNANSCLGLGVSVCDPITVNSTTVDNISSSSPSKTIMELSKSGDDSLINLSPTISPDLNLSNENNCLGIGISACDPITVGSDVTKTVTNSDDSSSDEKPDTVQSSYPTATSESTPTTTTASASASTSDGSSGGGLLNLSPDVSPDINLKNENSCQGIGISACDPITVNSTTTQNAS